MAALGFAFSLVGEVGGWLRGGWLMRLLCGVWSVAGWRKNRAEAAPAQPALHAHLHSAPICRMPRSLQLVSGLGPLSQLHYETGLR